MKRKIAALTLVLVCLLASCSREEDMNLQIVNQDVVIYNQLDTINNYQNVLNLINKNADMLTFCNALNISQYKSISDYFYTVIKTTDGYYVAMFDEQGLNPTLLSVSFSSVVYQDKMRRLGIGMSLNEVRKADPEGQYDFLLHSYSNYPSISYHYFESGDCYCIQYKDEKITQILHFTI